MKRFLAVVLMVFLMVGCFPVYAESIDLSGMSEEELVALIEAAEAELQKLRPSVGAEAVLYEDEKIKMTLNGEIEIEYGVLNIPVIVENSSNMNIIISTENCSFNGWDVLPATFSVSANGKAKGDLNYFDAQTNAEINAPEDVKEVKCNVRYFDSDTFDFSFESDQVVWVFG